MTERKRTEEALRDSETRYRRLFETAKDGILLLDAVSGQITDVNPFLIEPGPAYLRGFQLCAPAWKGCLKLNILNYN